MNPKKILFAVNILLTCLILWTASNLIITWTSREGVADTLQDRNPKQEGKDRKPLGDVRPITDYQAVIQQDMFRTTRQRPEALSDKAEEKKIEVTRLNLKLKGVVVCSISKSFAVIMDGRTKKEEIYYVNDSLQNAKIAKILPDQVILEVNNRQEALLLFTEGDKAEEGETSKPGGKPTIRQPGRVTPTPPSRQPARRLPGT